MKILISKKYLSLSIIVILSLLFYYMTTITFRSLEEIAWLNMSVITFLTISWFIYNRNIINYYTFFLLFCFLFYFSHFFLLIIGYEFNSNRNITGNLVSEKDLINSSILVIRFLILFHCTFIISFSIKLFKKVKSNIISISSLKKATIIMIIISIFPAFYIIINNIYITMQFGYGAIFQSDLYTSGGFSNIPRFLSNFFLPSMYLSVIIFKGSKYNKLIVTIISIYLSLYFLSGSRVDAVLMICIMILIYHYYYKKISIKWVIVSPILLILFSIIMSSISAFRNVIYSSTNNDGVIQSVFTLIKSSNPLLSVFEEAGYTFLVIGTVVSHAGSSVEFVHGASYINAIFMLFPNLFWDVHPAASINTDLVFQKYLTQYGGIGSSFIAEAYYNFGEKSLFLAPFFGVLLAVITKSFNKYSKTSPIMFFLTAYTAHIVLFFVRTDTLSLIRSIVYYGFSPIILALLINFFKKTNA